MERVYNFSAGPSMLPLSVLEKAAGELINYDGTGMSVMEMSHRTPAYEGIIFPARDQLKALMQIPDNYRILFLQGGATTQFAALCYNLLNGSGKADYVVTGEFAKKSMEEARKYGDIRVAASSEDERFSYIPQLGPDSFRKDADYVHICLNNTIFGTKYEKIPDTGDIPLVADLSSCILSEPFPVERFGVIYAGAQKNIAPAGLTIVIVREDLLGRAREDTPIMFNWKRMADSDSMYNTPPCYSIYMAKLVFEWLRDDIGGLEAMAAINRRKAGLLYSYLDGQDFYKTPARKDSRSMMNVCFRTGDDALDAAFVKAAADRGLKTLKGHRVIGGMRASIYNAMPEEGVEALVAFMAEFAKENAK